MEYHIGSNDVCKRSTRLGLYIFLFLGSLSGCIEELDPGEFGTPRYAANMRGAVPLRAVPPITDRDGNVYVAYGNVKYRDTAVYVGKTGGGWEKGCRGHRGDLFGLHGWIGRAQDRVWYWSGEALVEIAANDETCRLLDKDFRNNSLLHMQAVFPVVRESPSRTTAIALIQADPDPHPFFVVVDLFRNTYYHSESFQPTTAEDIEVIGTGGSLPHNQVHLLVQYKLDGKNIVEGRVYNLEGDEVSRARIPVREELPPYSVTGHLLSDDGKTITGLLDDGRRVEFDGTEGRILEKHGKFDAHGVHLWKKSLFLVGVKDGRPVFAPIENGVVGEATPWTVSERALEAMQGHNVRVVDERASPMTETIWSNPKSALGPFPFVSPYSPNLYTEHSAGWMLSGPSYRTSGDDVTAVAFVPIGIEYK